MIRLDVKLCEVGIFETRTKAQRAVKDKCVAVNGKIVSKPSILVADTDEITLVSEPLKYVSRGALKLVEANNKFNIDFTDKVVLDIGASTGGFTEVALENGAKKVYALDVGSDQLHPKLHQDKRVVSMEQTNFRYSKASDFDDLIDLCVTDVSFISLKLILPPLKDVLSLNGYGIVLIKPQFEAGKKALNKHGVCRDKKIHKKVIDDIVGFTKDLGFQIINLCDSPILGGEGNQEYLMYIKKTTD